MAPWKRPASLGGSSCTGEVSGSSGSPCRGTSWRPRVAIAAGLAAGSVALIGFGVDSGIEVVAAGALLWRFRTAGAGATDEERGEAERKALYVVAGTFFVLAAYIAVEGVRALASHEEPGTSQLGLGLSIASLIVMPALAWAKQQTGRQLGSRALQADAVET